MQSPRSPSQQSFSTSNSRFKLNTITRTGSKVALASKSIVRNVLPANLEFTKLSVVQYSGILDKRGLGISLRWKKCLFVIKDCFLIWFNKFPTDKDLNFSVRPSGFLPLASCIVSQEGTDSYGCIIQITIPAIDKNMKLRIPCANEADSLMKIMQQLSGISFEIMRVGRLKMDHLNSKGQKDERERELLLEKARENAKLTLEANETKREIMERQIKERRRKQRQLATERKKAKESDTRLRRAREKIEMRHEEFQAESKINKDLTGNLEAALQAIYKLTLIVLENKGPNKMRLLNDLSALGKMISGETD